MAYNKLFSSLVMSSVWREPDHVRIVWITLLALKDGRGEVYGSVPGLADAARVSRPLLEDALRVLSSPDVDSSNQENDGRRIEAMEGGWFVLNHSHYQRLMSVEERRERESARQRKYRAARTMSRVLSRDVANVTDVAQNTPLTPAPDQTIPDGSESLSKAAAAPDALALVRRVFDKWRELHHHPTAKLDAKRTARIRGALKTHAPEQLEAALSGALKDDWLMGRDPKSPRKYDGLETILRDAAQIERLIELEQGKGGATPRKIPARGVSLQRDVGVDPMKFFKGTVQKGSP